tara:strand:+ start:162 stop:374 length:213 start_codon:yes stop_codon:yes gene_type:complete
MIIYYSSADAHNSPDMFLEEHAAMISFWPFHHGKKQVKVPKRIEKMFELRLRKNKKLKKLKIRVKRKKPK